VRRRRFSVVGFVIQGNGATTPARSVGINSVGQAIATYTPTIPAGQAVVMTFATVGQQQAGEERSRTW
jgi:hypothetical protein